VKKFILDANVIFSALISGKQLFLQLFESNSFYTPDFVFIEIEKYKNKIIKKV
jgi:predicted nucleic acid-binding protein